MRIFSYGFIAGIDIGLTLFWAAEGDIGYSLLFVLLAAGWSTLAVVETKR